MKAKRNNIIRRCGLLLVLLLSVVPACWADSIPEKLTDEQVDDSVSYELPRPKDFNALRFALDDHHRYQGDIMPKDNYFIDFGAGITLLKHNNTKNVEPVTTLHLRLGRQFSPLHAARVGISGGVGYMPSGLEGEGPQTLMGMIGGQADYLFSMSNYLLGYRPERPLDVSVMMGLGFNQFMIGGGHNKETAYNLKESSFSYNFHAGLQMKLFAGPHAAITAEPFIMLSNVNADLADQGTNWHRYHVAYGLNLSYIYYLENHLTPPSLTGRFKRNFADGERWLRGDAADKKQRRPLFVHYGAGMAAYNTFEGLRWGKTIGPTAGIGFGGWLSSAIGLRTVLSATNGKWSETGDKTNMIGYASASVEALINPFGFTRHYDWDAPVGLNIFAGYELGMLKMVNAGGRNSSYVIGYRMGVQPWVRLGHDMRFFVEPAYTFLRHRQGDQNRKRDDQVSLMAGVELMIGGRQDSPATADNTFLPSGYFVGLGGGWNTTIRRWKYSSDNDTPFKNALLFAGYHFDPFNGVMLSEEYLTDKIGLQDGGEQRWENWMTSASYQLNVSNLFTGYQPGKRWNVSVMLGPTVAFNSKKAHFGGHLGFQIDYRFAKHFAFFYQHRLYWMDWQMYKSDQLFNPAGTIISSMNVGLMYQFDDIVAPTVWVAKRTAHGVSSAATTVAHGVGAAAKAVAHGVSSAAKATAHGVGNLFKQQRSPFFMDYGYGMAWFPGMPAKGGDSWGSSLQLAAGWWMIPAVGLRAGINVAKGGALSVKGSEVGASNDIVTTTAYGSLFADVMVNPLGFVSNYNWDQRFGVNLFGGLHKGIIAVEGYHSEARGKNLYASGWRAGMQLWVKLQDDLRLHVEPTYTRMKCNEIYVNDAQTAVRRNAADGYSLLDSKEAMSVRVGLTALLRNPKKRATGDHTTFTNPGFFVGAGGGWNFNLSKWNYSNSGLNVNALLYGGYTFNEYHALRAQAEYLSDAVSVSGKDAERLNMGLFSVDYQLDMTTLLSGYNAQRRWDVAMFLGPSATNKGKVGLNGGLNIGYQLNEKWGLFYNHNLYMISDANMFRQTQISGKMAIINTFNLGVKYKF